MVVTIVEILVGMLVLTGLVVTLDFLAGRWFFVERTPDEIHFATTSDRWRIAVFRYRPTTPNGAEPVVLCHGVAANRLNMDLTEELSFARALAAAGYDTWIIELRGRGLSTRPRLFSKYDYDWSFDEYVEQDAPAAIDAVLRATGRERVHWVGFSVGGAVAYALLGDPRQAEKIRTAVCLGAPASFAFQQKYLFSWPFRNLRWLRHQLLMRLLAPISGYWRPRILHNPDNIDGAVIRKFMVNGAANFARNEMLQYGDWIANDAFRSIDHRRDYRKDLAKVTTPILLVAGNKDLIAPPPSVKAAYDLVASTDKKFVMASRGQSLEANYGHLDLVIGTNAPKDIYPLVRAWLDEHTQTKRAVEGDGAVATA